MRWLLRRPAAMLLGLLLPVAALPALAGTQPGAQSGTQPGTQPADIIGTLIVGEDGAISGRPLIIAHRGASYQLPEHTLEAYAAAYFMGADFIEPDVVLSADGHLVCLHDLTLNETTDAATLFPDRARDDGEHYAADFTLHELKTLSVRSRHEDPNSPDAQGYQIPTLDELLGLIRRLSRTTGRTVGVIPEPKSPAWHREEGRTIEPVLLDTLARFGYLARADSAIVQCFDLDSLRTMREELATDLRLVYLISEPIGDAEFDEAAAFCDGFGPRASIVIKRMPAGFVETGFIGRAHAAGLKVYPWTFVDDAEHIAAAMRAGVDGLFVDDTTLAVRVREALTVDQKSE